MKIIVTAKSSVRNDRARVVFDAATTSTYVRRGVRGADIVLAVPRSKPLSRRGWIILLRTAIRAAREHGFASVVFVWKGVAALDNAADKDTGQVFAEAVLMAAYEFRAYKSAPREGWHDVKEVLVVVRPGDTTFRRAALRRGVTIATQVNFCRDLANTPGGDMTPVKFVAMTRRAVAATGITLRVLDEKQMRRKRMNGILTVGAGSALASRFMILEYVGTRARRKPTVLIGKGVTFDSGGIDTKPYPFGTEMMMDMSGGAAVVATMIAAARLKLPQRIIGLIPTVENMPGGSSMRPGDIVTMMDGTHVEIRNTDAEGRLILADALAYAARLRPARVIDVATLTGAAMVALGERASAVFSDNEMMVNAAVAAGKRTGDSVWRLPVWDEYAAEIVGTHGDIANTRTKGQNGFGGAITAAVFLKHFAAPFVENWMHIDIAPTMTAVHDEQLAAGAKGSPVRMLVELLSRA